MFFSEDFIRSRGNVDEAYVDLKEMDAVYISTASGSTVGDGKWVEFYCIVNEDKAWVYRGSIAKCQEPDEVLHRIYDMALGVRADPEQTLKRGFFVHLDGKTGWIKVRQCFENIRSSAVEVPFVGPLRLKAQDVRDAISESKNPLFGRAREIIISYLLDEVQERHIDRVLRGEVPFDCDEIGPLEKWTCSDVYKYGKTKDPVSFIPMSRRNFEDTGIDGKFLLDNNFVAVNLAISYSSGLGVQARIQVANILFDLKRKYQPDTPLKDENYQAWVAFLESGTA